MNRFAIFTALVSFLVAAVNAESISIEYSFDGVLANNMARTLADAITEMTVTAINMDQINKYLDDCNLIVDPQSNAILAESLNGFVGNMAELRGLFDTLMCQGSDYYAQLMNVVPNLPFEPSFVNDLQSNIQAQLEAQTNYVQSLGLRGLPSPGIPTTFGFVPV